MTSNAIETSTTGVVSSPTTAAIATKINDDTTQTPMVIITPSNAEDAAQTTSDIQSETTLGIVSIPISLNPISSDLTTTPTPISSYSTISTPIFSNSTESLNPQNSSDRHLSQKLLFILLPTTLLIIVVALIFYNLGLRRRRRNNVTNNAGILFDTGRHSDDRTSTYGNLVRFGFAKCCMRPNSKNKKPHRRHRRTSTVLQFEAMHRNVVVVDVGERQNNGPKRGNIIITGNDGRNGDRRMIKVLEWKAQCADSSMDDDAEGREMKGGGSVEP